MVSFVVRCSCSDRSRYSDATKGALQSVAQAAAFKSLHMKPNCEIIEDTVTERDA